MSTISNGALGSTLTTPVIPQRRDRLVAMPVDQPKRVLLAAPRGYCAGVDRAVIAVEKALEQYGAPVYVRKQIVHNIHVVTELEKQGAIFVDEVEEVPPGSHIVFSAHGVSPAVVQGAADRDLQAIDATCPLVTKVHREAVRFAKQDYRILLIGHAGHEEVEGTMGHAPERTILVNNPDEADLIEVPEGDELIWLSQTTLSVDDTRHIIDALRNRFPDIVGPDVKDICYATQNRQSVVRKMVENADVILVIGADYSSNSNRLREIGTEAGVASYLLPDAAALDPAWLAEAKIVGVTAGASAPEELVQGLIQRLGELFEIRVSELETVPENVQFKLPQELTAPRKRLN